MKFKATLETIGPLAENLWEIVVRQHEDKELPFYVGHGRSRLEATMKAIAELRSDFRETDTPGGGDLAQQALTQLKSVSEDPAKFEAPQGSGVAMYAIITVINQQQSGVRL